jgi:hypothetical protein
MTTGTALDAQLMLGQESAWGTGVTPTRTLEFNDEGLTQDLTWLEPKALHRGIKAKRGSRAQISRRSVSGDINLDINTLGMGMLVRNMLGSTTATTTLIAGSAYKQIHTPGDFRGMGVTVQVGRPEPSTGTVQPFTFSGCKFTSWELALKDNSTPSLKLSVDGRQETTVTALATAAYLTGSSVFTFVQSSLKLGGTPATAAGETTVSGGTAVATIVKDFSVGGATPMAGDRYGLGNAGLKAEPLENDTPTYTGKLGAEFNMAEFYANYVAGTPTTMQFTLLGSVIGGGNNYLFDVIMPMVKFKKAAPNVNGPDIVQMSTDYEVYSNEIDPVIQIKIVSTEATAV